MVTVFLVQHEYETPAGCDEVKLVGVYSSRDEARRAIDRVRDQPGFRRHPDGFHISELTIDRDHWTEGFVIMGGEDAIVETVTPIDEMAGDRAPYEQACRYLAGHAWCAAIRRAWFGIEIAGVTAFLFELERHDDGEPWLWVVTGDLPQAHLGTADARTAHEALERYCELMDEPGAAAPTREHAEQLERRVAFVRRELLQRAR